ncbi:MAG: UDP-N-acetylmuramate--L-alanine ligase [Gammaproteobacteria bacterium]|nr:UDP-N-acetylmuramate--L-alanine ligase [Gammaproteobacteria bacterium]
MNAWRHRMRRVRRVHFIGIGGAGMSGIADVLLGMGYEVSGSDLKLGTVTDRLSRRGAVIFEGHDAQHVNAIDVVVISSAVKNDNPEVLAAHAHLIPVVSRAEMLAEIMRFRQGIAIAGTHGKTTTTSFIATIMAGAGLDPTFVIGGKLNSVATHAQLGAGEYLVAEADESDASFLYLKPIIAVVTNIDADHMATYENDFNKLTATFLQFLHQLPFYGLAVLCADDPVLHKLLPEIGRPVLTYGIESAADVRAENLQPGNGRTRFDVVLKDGARSTMDLALPGRHNVLNALASIAVAVELGIELNKIQEALASFQGIGRRFQITNNIKMAKGLVTLVDDYGHHPTEIRATLAAARETWPDRRIVLVFQPHRYSRTHDLMDDFSQVLSQADVLCLCEVYSAGETLIAGADGRALAQAVRARSKLNPIFIPRIVDLPDTLTDVLQANDVVLVMGAGDIGAMAQQLPQRLQEARA